MGCSISSLCRTACYGDLLGDQAHRVAEARAGSSQAEASDPEVPASSANGFANGFNGQPTPSVVGKATNAPATVPSDLPKAERARDRSHTADAIGQDREFWGQEENVLDHVKQWMHEQEKANESKSAAMGMWQGVIFPCMANILGVILFLRLPWIVGKAGILSGFFLVFICCCCTFITTLSLSAVATNGKILGGGSYYLISRSLGPALGAGVGLCFYMANSIGAAMYFMGTVEAWEIAAPNYQLLTAGELNNIRVTGFLILAVALIVVAGGIKYVAKLGTVFLFIVLLVIVFMYLGLFIGPGDNDDYNVNIVDAAGEVHSETMTWSAPSRTYFMENFWPDYDAPQQAFPLDTVQYNFIPLMGLWFPACTGIMAGSNRSADLKDPAAYIPRGTLFAQVCTSLIYLSFTVLYGCVAPRKTLLDDKFFAASSAWPLKQLVVYGVIASTLGAGLTSLTSGTRLLSAIALDKTLPILAVFGVKPGQEPRLALVASGVLCACAIAIGELNAIAPVLTMFFLMCYTCVNCSCAVLEAVGDPNWRPRFRFHHWSVSLLGAILCLWMMFAMNPIMAAVAMLFCAIVFSYASFNSAQAKWGDGFQGMKFQIAKNILTKMDLKVHAKNWRPQLLVVTKASLMEDAHTEDELVQVHDPELLKFVSQLKGGRGFVIVGGICCNGAYEHYIEGAGMFSGVDKFKASDGQVAMQKLLGHHGISGFGRIIYTHDFQEGLMGLVQNAGLGSFQPNSVIASWPREWRSLKKEGELARMHLIRLVQASVAFNKVTIIPKGQLWPDSLVRLGGFIDIWWIVGDGGILLLLPFLLKKHRVWRECRTRLWVLADKVGDDPAKIRNELRHYVKEFRLDIEVHVKIVDPDSIDFGQELAQMSSSELHSSHVHREEEYGLRRELSGRSSTSMQVVEEIQRWVRENTPENRGDRQSSASGGFPNGPPGRTSSRDSDGQRAASLEGISVEMRETSDSQTSKAPKTVFTNHELVRQMSGGEVPKLSDMVREVSGGASDAPFHAFSNYLEENAGGFTRSFRGAMSKTNKKGGFLHSKDQLTSTKPMSAEDLLVPRGLNKLIMSESREAELVVTNLPDMSKSESAFGYFQFVDAMTKGLPRVVLVRGTTSEVITAFT